MEIAVRLQRLTKFESVHTAPGCKTRLSKNALLIIFDRCFRDITPTHMCRSLFALFVPLAPQMASYN